MGKKNKTGAFFFFWGAEASFYGLEELESQLLNPNNRPDLTTGKQQHFLLKIKDPSAGRGFFPSSSRLKSGAGPINSKGSEISSPALTAISSNQRPNAWL